MLDEHTTPAAEVNEPEETVNDDTQDEVVEDSEETIGDLTDETEDEAPMNIPKARLDKEITRRKELEKQLADLQEAKEEGYNTPASESKESDLEARLAKMEAKEKAEKLNATLESNIAKALENAPEFKDIINMDVLKQMALNPVNKNKTYSQLLEDAYGNAVSGKRTIETTTPRGGANDPKVDIQKAQNDPEYRREVLADPGLRKQYNDNLQDRISL